MIVQICACFISFVVPNWSEGIEYEINFWTNWLRKKGDRWPEDYKRRLDPDAPFYFSEHLTSGDELILNVGSGPMHGDGFLDNEKRRLNILCTDPLAMHYTSLLRQENVHPTVPVFKLFCENITTTFAKDAFGFVYSVNALDHSENPLSCIKQMIHVLKPMRRIMILTKVNEGAAGKYHGFHQHNFFTNAMKQLKYKGKYDSYKVNVNTLTGVDFQCNKIDHDEERISCVGTKMP